MEENGDTDSYDLIQESATCCYGDMLHDEERNIKFGLALKKAIKKCQARGEPAHVLDIGTGTGLLAMLAVRHGADSVIACEMFAPVAECAKNIIAKNGLADQIKVVQKHSTSLTVGPDGDLPHKANILVSEVFDTELIGEGAIQTFNHAHAYLLQENSIVIPSMGTIYCEVVESASLVHWNTVEDWAEEEKTHVEIPSAVRKCPGAASLFDVQLSQLPAKEFTSLSGPVPIFHFDFMSCQLIPTHECEEIAVRSINNGTAQAVFVWWDLVMDDGAILLSCAPVWHHPQEPKTLPEGNPARDIPWRDHWMQAVYFLRQETKITEGAMLTVRGWHDEFSLWFAACQCGVAGPCECPSETPPSCICGLHLICCRTRLAAINDPTRRKAFYCTVKALVQRSKYFIVVGDFSLLGLLAANLGASKVYILATNPSNLLMRTYADFIPKYSNIISLHFDVESIVKDIENEVSLNSQVANELCIMGEPYFSTSLLPWDNVRFSLIKEKFFELAKNFVARENVCVSPLSLEVKAVMVQFDDLWKISRPLGTCMGLKLDLFDELVGEAKRVAQVSPEPQPLWEYPCIAQSDPVNLLTLQLSSPLEQQSSQTCLIQSVKGSAGRVDGVAVWAEYTLESGDVVSSGPVRSSRLGEYVQWDRCERQGVHLLETPLDPSKGLMCTVEFSPTESNHLKFMFIECKK